MPDEAAAVPDVLVEATPIESTPEVGVDTPAEQPTAPVTGTRSSLRNLRRQLTDEELKQTGVQKLLIESIERAEADCDALRLIVEKYHDADKEVSRLTERLKVNVAMEIITGIGLTGGGAIMSLGPYFWEPNTGKGIAVLAVGFMFIVGSTLAKIMQVRR